MSASRPIRRTLKRLASRTLDWRQTGALIAFGAVAVIGPLAFGAVDRAVQTVLVLLLAAGAFLRPPAVIPLTRRGNIFVITLVAILVLKEFAPHQWFGGTRWRNATDGLAGLALSWTHHPEPARAFDALLTSVIAIFWLQWVRTLASRRGTRVLMAWILLGSGVVVAAVCFAIPGSPGGAIFGVRHTPGWIGWGPFPNRNHTASLLSMAAAVGLGCVAWAVVRRQKRLAVAATASVVIIVTALLVSKSRGGLLAFLVGLVVLVGLIVWKHRERLTFVIAAGGMGVFGFCAMFVCSRIIGRFGSGNGPNISNEMRVATWRNSIEMWKDAPLFGHGIGTFRWLFPFYQKLTLDDNVVLHPESSWLQWLNELGLVPLLLLLFSFGWLLLPRLGALFERRGTFYLAAGALAGVAAIGAHALVDVPAHRWGTAGFALALLGLACPVTASGAFVGTVPGVARPPLVAGIYWALPFFGVWSAWQPVSVEQLRAREASGQLPRPGLKEWQRALRYFPLDADLHHFAALRELETGVPKTSDWQKHIEIAHRLVPGGWRLPITHARAVVRVSPALCIQYWQVATERSGWRAVETFGRALQETAGLPEARFIWAEYVRRKPEFALAYAKMAPGEDPRGMFMLWWNSRAAVKDMAKEEIADFYHFAGRFATADQIEQWIRFHGKRRAVDYQIWLRLLHAKGQDERAWSEYRLAIPEPAYPARRGTAARAEIENRIRMAPESPAHLLDLLRLVAASGDVATEREMILEAAGKPGAVPWFLRKGAYLLAKEGKFRDAVALAIREK